eukprot:TRINITY_DN6001_c0_g1_i1.p1 TRINITY_DN6001_c0_g1~~TRINITY_DN6001_c0_g1_i1.p1  ORF type:complete len:383 (+),score=65.13 TRINITY_DN6001_c0_g1_i1:60-1208(+)
MLSKQAIRVSALCGRATQCFFSTSATRPTSDSAAVEITPPPEQLPHFTLPTGDRIPSIGMGTFTGTRLTAQAEPGTMKTTVKTWLRIGGRMIDAAQNYLNEDEIGNALSESIDEGIVTRDEVFLSSKLNNPYHRPEWVRPALEKTLMDLKVDYLDMYLMHWPTAFVPVEFDATQRGFPMEYEPDQCSKVTGVEWKDLDGSWPPPHLDQGVSVHDTWDAMIECYKDGLVRNIGVCNFKIQLLHELMSGKHDIIPHVLQNESHPFNQQWRQLEFCQKAGIQFMAYSPLGYGAFKDPNEVTVLSDPTLAEIGAKHGISTAAVALQWCVQRGVNTMPFSLRESELRENLLVGTWELDAADMELIKTLDRRHHYLDPYNWYGLPLWD